MNLLSLPKGAVIWGISAERRYRLHARGSADDDHTIGYSNLAVSRIRHGRLTARELDG